MAQDVFSVQEQEDQARNQVLDLIAQCPRCHQKEEDVQMIRRAFELANDAHRGMKRKSGELYIFHPVSGSSFPVVSFSA